MLPKEDRKAMLLRLYNEIIPLQDTSKERFSKNKGNNTMNDTTKSDINGEARDETRVDDAPYGTDDLQIIMDATSDEEAEVEENTV